MNNKQPVSILNEAAQKKIIPEPLYSSKQVGTGFVTDVTLGNKTYQSKVASTKAQSKEEVASMVLQSITNQTVEKVLTYETICKLMLRLDKYPQTERCLKMIQLFGAGKEFCNFDIQSVLLAIFTTMYVKGEPFSAILAEMWNKLMHTANGNCVKCDRVLMFGSQTDIDGLPINQFQHGSMFPQINDAEAQAIRASMDAELLPGSELDDESDLDIGSFDGDFGDDNPSDDEAYFSFAPLSQEPEDDSKDEESAAVTLTVLATIKPTDPERSSLLAKIDELLRLKMQKAVDEDDDVAIFDLRDQSFVAHLWDTPIEELNALMHALNGNGSNQSKQKRPSTKTAVKKEVKKDVKKEVKKLGEKRVRRQAPVRMGPIAKPVGRQNKLQGENIRARSSNGRTLNLQGEKSVIELMKSAFKAELKAIVAPSAVPPVRYATIFASAKTAIAAPWRQDDADWGISTTPTTLLPLNTMMSFLFRDAARHTVTYHANTTAYRYNAWMQSLSGGVLSTDWTGTIPSSGLGLDLAYLAPASDASTFAHGLYLPVGVTEANRKGGIPISLGEVIELRFATDSASENSFIVEVYQFDGEDFKPVENITVANDSVNWTTYTPPATGYFYFKVYGVVTLNPEAPIVMEDCSLELSLVNAGKPYFAHRMLPDLEQKLNSIRSIRIIGTSILYTNTAPNLQKQGKIAAFQASGNIHWTTFVAQGFAEISSSQGGSKAMAGEKGLYTFLKPTEEGDFEMQNPIDYDGSILCKIKFTLDKCKSYMAVGVVVEDDAGKSGVFTYGSSVEFETEDTWFVVNEPKTDKRVFDQALNAVKSVPQFHENPSHLSDIWDAAGALAGKLFNGIMTYGPRIIAGAQMLSTLL